MVEIIGVVTIIALTWLLASSMANESEAEKRRCARMTGFAATQDKVPSVFTTKDAA
jgi:steroid 5-alpha reductase family enzyme